MTSMDKNNGKESDSNGQHARSADSSVAATKPGGGTEDLIDRIKESADKLARDVSSRGDLKILSRTLRELRHAFKVFTPYRSRRKVSVFGSARTQSDDPRYELAVAFGRAMAERDWLIVTGAASGIMEAGHQGAGRDHSMGLNIMLPFEQDANPVIAGDHKLVHMKYFFTRKLMFVKECDAVVCFPGGFGTMDEALEVITLLQTGKREIVPVMLLDVPGKSYWDDFRQFVLQHLLHDGMIAREDLALFRIADNVTDAVDEIMNFFRIYHSMRYVSGRLVFRLTQSLSEAQLEKINSQFADILVRGEFEQCKALAEERNEPEVAHLPRLVFHFNRRNLGRLRQLIDYLNGECLNV